MLTHWGAPRNPGELKFHTGTLLSKDVGGTRMGRRQFSRAEVAGLYGISFGKLYIGVMLFGKRGWDTEEAKPWNAPPQES